MKRAGSRPWGDGNSSLVAHTVGIATTEAVQQGVVLYKAFNHGSPTQVVRVRHPRVIPPVVVELGELVGLIYRSDKGQPGRPRTYIHFMENPPRLVTNVEGTQLHIVGGSYRVTPKGIEG